jgi:PAS domain S-box-containing protein
MKKSSRSKNQSKTEITLKESEQRYRITMMSVGDGVIATDTEGRVEMMNPVAEDLTGWKEEDALGKPLEEIFCIINEETRKTVENPVRSVISEGIVVGLANHSVLIAKDGTERPIADSGSPIRNEKEEITGVVLVFRDQTQERTAQKVLLESEAKYRTLVENIPQGIFMKDRNYKWVSINENFARSLGVRPNDIVGKVDRDLFPWDIADKYHADDVRIMETGQTEEFEEESILDGKHVWVNTIKTPVRDENGEIIGVFGIFWDITQRKLAEKALQESKEKYYYLYENSPVGMYHTKIDGSKVLEINNSACEMLGLAKEEILGQPSSMRWADPNRRNEILKILKEYGVAINFDAEILKKDGSKLSCLLSMKIFKEEGYIEGFMIDISDRKRAEEVVKDNEKRFRELIESLPQLFWTCRVDGPCDYLSRQWVEYTGIPEAEQLGYRWLEQLHPEDRDRTVSYWMEKVITGRSFDIEFRIRRNDGVYHWFKTTAVPMHDSEGNIIKWFGSNTDFDEIKKAEEQLRNFSKELEQKVDERTKELQRSKKLLDETGRLARIGGWEIDIKDNSLYWSEMTHIIHEVDPYFVPDLNTAINFYAPESVPVISQCVDKAIRLGEPFDVELELITAKKNRLWVRAIGEVYREKGTIVKIGGVFQDINSRKLIQEEIKKHHDHLEELVSERTKELDNAVIDLKRSNQELEQFAYIASHDLQEPLRMVSSYTQLLERRYKDQLDQDAKDFINFAVDGANRMQRLINDLLDYSRVTTKGKALVKTDLSLVLGHAIANLHNKIQETNAMITNEDLPFAYCDEIQIVRLFQNLIDNAIKFRERETPRIHIKGIIENDKVLISVGDNGIGIDKIYTERVFTIFQRLHNKTDYPGTGIGLAICKRTVERHGGKIWFESEPGKGTTFFFTLNK